MLKLLQVPQHLYTKFCHLMEALREEISVSYNLKIQVVWDLTQCQLVNGYWCSEGSYCLHIQGHAHCRKAAAALSDSPHLQAARSSTTLETIHHSCLCNIPRDFILGIITTRNWNLGSTCCMTLLQLNRPFYCTFRKKSKGILRQAEVALGVLGTLRPQNFSTFGTTRVVGRQPNAPPAFTPGEIPGSHFQRLSRPQGIWFCQKEPRKKSQVTPPGIDPGTVRLVAQRLNHYATPGPYFAMTQTINSYNKQH